MKKILAILIIVKFMFFVWPGFAFAQSTQINGRWLDYYEEGDSIRTEQGVAVTTRVGEQKAGAYLKTGLLKWDFSASSVTFRVKASNWRDVKVASLVVGNGTKFDRAATIDIKTRLVNPPNDEWVQLTVPFSAWSIDGNIDWERVDNVLFAVSDLGYQRVTANISSIVVQKQPKLGAVSITIDDGLIDTTRAESMLRDAGLVGTAFIDVEYIGKDGYITEDDVVRMVNEGWQLGGHRIGRLSQLSDQELVAHVERTYEYLRQHGVKTFEYALPNGLRTARIVDALEKRFAYVHNIDGMSNDGTHAIPTNINRHSIDKHTSLDAAKRWIDAAKQGEWVIINFHTFSATWANEEDWSEEDFVSLIKYAQAQEVPIMTTSAAIKQFEPQKIRLW